MFDKLKKLIGEGNTRDGRNKEDLGDIKENPINELQILEEHTDIVRLLLKIDEMRIASASDDGTISIWHILTGEKLTTLRGHTHPITCMMLLERGYLVSGSADKTIRLWDLASNTSKVLKAHTGSIKCIISLDSFRFCSGSNDRQICIWNTNGDLVNTIERQEEENLHCLLPISGNRLITGSNSSLLLVYKTDTCTYLKVLAYHRESVRCLVRISASLFASASMDGAIVVWQTDSLTAVKILHNPDKYRNESRVYIYDVKYLLALGEKYLAAAIGNGFRIYDVLTGDCVMDCKNAHEAEVNHLISLYDGTRIVSCSADSSIRLWGTSQKINFRQRKRDKTDYDEPKGPRLKLQFNRSIKVDPICLGEMWGHSDSVNQLLPVTENSFASCSSDKSVILWKDGRVESELRNRYAAMVLRKQASLVENGVDYFGSSWSTGSFMLSFGEYSEDKRRGSFKMNHSIDFDSESSVYEDASDYSENDVRNGMIDEDDEFETRVPQYIFDHADMLRREKQYTIEQIANHMRDEGHSEAIIAAVSRKHAMMK